MIQKYKIPIQLFIVFEKIQIQLWTSSSNLPNHFFVHLPQKWLFSVNLFFKKELFFWNSYLVDSSAIDTLNYKITNTYLTTFLKTNNIIIFYIYYFYFLKIKINISVVYNNFLKKHLSSIDGIFLNSNWIERETSEMFGINYFNKKDVRKLLIDYSSFENPLLKTYPTEGFFDVFYNFFEDQVVTNDASSFVEL